MISPRGLLFLSSLAVSAVTAVNLNVTAISACDGQSQFECWQVDTPFFTSTQDGLVGTATASLGDVANITFNVVPPNFDGGFHRAPYNQWVMILSGIGAVSLPDENSTTITFGGGQPAVLFAADTAEVSTRGHRSQFPGVTESVVLQIPTNGEIPAHTVLQHGPCNPNQYTGLHDLAFAR